VVRVVDFVVIHGVVVGFVVVVGETEDVIALEEVVGASEDAPNPGEVPSQTSGPGIL
jgi:hypothetical protein